MLNITTVLVLVASYLLGSLPFGFMAARLNGVDITKKGSGNTGATNVLRTLGYAYAVPVLLLDVGKGALAAYLGMKYLGGGPTGALMAGTAAVCGHNWSVFLKFRGGKGVAATAGVALVAFPTLLEMALAVFVVVLAITRYVSVASLIGVWAAFLFSLTPSYRWSDRLEVLVLVILITYQHRANIKRLRSGTESKFSLRLGSGGSGK